MHLRNGHVAAVLVEQPGIAPALEQEGQQIGGTLGGRASPDAEQVLVENALLARRKPGQVEGKPRMLLEQVEQAASLEDTERDRRQRLDGMLHLGHDRALQADHVAGHDIVEDLPAAVLEDLVAEPPTFQ
ncbi:hypothetical protein D3C72_1870750 [compost metagenome]